jgi:alpha-1,3-rhamnosyl/mannosyltransferase
MTHYALDARAAAPHFPGIGRYVANLAAAMAAQLRPDERLTLIGPKSLPREVVPNSRVRPLPLADSVFSLHQQRSAPRLLRTLRADLYHSPYYLMPYRPGVITVLTVYDLITLHFPDLASTRARLLFRLTTSLALQAAHRVIAISDATRLDYSAHFPIASGRAVTIPLAVGTAFEPASDTALATVRTKYVLPERYVLYVGSNKPHKNLVRLVEAWKLADRADAVLVLGGQWEPAQREVQKAVLSSGLGNSVRLLGPICEQDLPALYGAAEIFVFPSLYEGFGLPVLEAMACGAPVACSNTSSLPEIAGEAARLFTPTNTNAIAAALSDLMSAPGERARLRERGLARAAEYSWERTAAGHLALYRAITEGRSPTATRLTQGS